jgi:hypothetical protein
MKSLLADIRVISRSIAAIVGSLSGITTVAAYYKGDDWQFGAFCTLALLALANLDRGRGE